MKNYTDYVSKWFIIKIQTSSIFAKIGGNLLYFYTVKIFSAKQIRKWDAFSIQEEAIASLQLMERAAKACVQWICYNYNPSKVNVFCGSGNNGGDGLVMAHLLYEKQYDVQVFVLKAEKYSDDFLSNLKILPLTVIYIEDENDFPDIIVNTIIVDALFGTGLNKPLSGIAEKLVQYLNKSIATVISIDVPSGMFSDLTSKNYTTIKANYTLSFQDYKLAFMITENLPLIGALHILPIGLSDSFYNATNTHYYSIDHHLANQIYKPRNTWVHKYNVGHALVFAGSKTMMGAALLCSKACMRTGAGLVTLHISAAQMPILHTALPEVIASDEEDLQLSFLKKNVLAFGPGLEVNESNQKLLVTIIEFWKGGLVIDASGLLLLQPLLASLANRNAPAVLTPHTGEFEKLFGNFNNDFERLEEAKRQAQLLKLFIILKAPHTIIACPDGDVYFNTTGNSGMATAGSGDVLTGIITGLLAQNYTTKDACIMGVYLHGLAGDIAANKISQESLIASDIIENIGEGYKFLNRK